MQSMLLVLLPLGAGQAAGRDGVVGGGANLGIGGTGRMARVPVTVSGGGRRGLGTAVRPTVGINQLLKAKVVLQF
jgi:hypothetical protein